MTEKKRLDSHSAHNELLDVNADLSDVGISKIFEEGGYESLAQVPIVRTILGLAKAGASVRDRLFTHKVLLFLAGLDVDSQLREKIERSFESIEAQQDISERWLLALEQFDRISKTKILSKLFLACINRTISQQDFSRLIYALNRMDVDDVGTLTDLYKGHKSVASASDELRSLLFLKLESVTYRPKLSTSCQIWPPLGNENVGETFQITRLGKKFVGILKT